jgi:hypothetical protein
VALAVSEAWSLGLLDTLSVGDSVAVTLADSEILPVFDVVSVGLHVPEAVYPIDTGSLAVSVTDSVPLALANSLKAGEVVLLSDSDALPAGVCCAVEVNVPVSLTVVDLAAVPPAVSDSVAVNDCVMSGLCDCDVVYPTETASLKLAVTDAVSLVVSDSLDNFEASPVSDADPSVLVLGKKVSVPTNVALDVCVSESTVLPAFAAVALGVTDTVLTIEVRSTGVADSLSVSLLLMVNALGVTDSDAVTVTHPESVALSVSLAPTVEDDVSLSVADSVRLDDASAELAAVFDSVALAVSDSESLAASDAVALDDTVTTSLADSDSQSVAVYVDVSVSIGVGVQLAAIAGYVLIQVGGTYEYPGLQVGAAIH